MKHEDIKQGEENIAVAKEENDPKRNYIFQKDGITKTGFFIIVAFLILIIIGIVISGVFFKSPAAIP